MGRGFIGDTVTVGLFAPVYDPVTLDGLQAYGSARVGGHVEFPDFSQVTNVTGGPLQPDIIDVSANKIGLVVNGSEGASIPPGIFDGFVVGFAGKPNDSIKSVTLEDTNIEGLDQHSILHNRRQVTLNGSGVTFPSYEPAFLNLSVQFRRSGQATASHETAKHVITGEP